MQRLFLRVNLFGTIALVPLALAFLYLGDFGPAVVNAAYALLSASIYAWLLRTNRGYGTLINVQLFSVQLVAATTTYMLGGFSESGFGFVWALLGPMAAVVFTSARKVWRWFLLFLLLLGALFVFQRHNVPAMPHMMWMGLSFSNLGGASALILLMLYQATTQLRAEQQRSELLLLNVLPKDIAQILKDKPGVVADFFPQASVLFADVVGFTPLSAQMEPVALVQLLNEVFSHFDGLAENYGVEKIKTIGDCYMIASGVPSPRPDHADVLVKVAIEMQRIVQTHTFGDGRKIGLRIGINSGPVVAGVIGRKKFIYDLWGDTVNMASRMESHGAEGAIQITASTRALIAREFECRAQTPVDVKGCGPTPVWHVLAPDAAAVSV